MFTMVCVGRIVSIVFLGIPFAGCAGLVVLVCDLLWRGIVGFGYVVWILCKVRGVLWGFVIGLVGFMGK